MSSPSPTLNQSPDYYLRALAHWPRLEPPRTEHVRHDPHRMATRISRRTRLSQEAILALLGAREELADPPPPDR
jgi:hypothetical protein